MTDFDIPKPTVEEVKVTAESKVQELEKKVGKEDAKIAKLAQKIRDIMKSESKEMKDNAISYEELLDAFKAAGIAEEKYEEYAMIIGIKAPISFHLIKKNDRNWIGMKSEAKSAKSTDKDALISADDLVDKEIQSNQPEALRLLAQDFPEFVELTDVPGEFIVESSYVLAPGMKDFTLELIRGLNPTKYKLQGKMCVEDLKYKAQNESMSIGGTMSLKKMAGALQIMKEASSLGAAQSQLPYSEKNYKKYREDFAKKSKEYLEWIKSKD
jgi:hypothetical protein